MKSIAGLRCSVMVLGVLASAFAQAQGIVGRTAGEASVSATGAARYTIPLTLPPGTNGLAPALAVTYDSRSGNGLLGVGFRLTGLSAIQRCGNTLAQDGRLGAVALDSADRFCLDGQRLRLTAGVYGQPGSQYQTETESFSRVTAIGMAGTGPASFRVERSDGLIYEYGTTFDARVESANSATPREWALNRIRDRNGNHADFVYAEDVVTGSHRPLRIDYAGNTQTGAVPYYSVRFLYEARPAGDLPSAYIAGGVVSESTRLDRIDVVHTATGSTLRSYDFTYGTPGTTGRSRLASLQECVPGGCLTATQFGWSFVYAGWAVNFSIPLPVDRLASAIPGDVDGDGFDDLTYHDATLRRWMVLRGNGNGFHSVAVDTGFGSDSDPTQALSADLDGDGKRDVLVPGSGNYWHRLRHAGNGTYAYNALGVINPAPPGGLIAADIDGDGRDDLVYVKSAGDAIFWRRNQTVTSSSYAAEAVLWSLPAGTRLPAAPFIETTQRFRSVVRSGDVNGDGRTDLLVLTQLSACGATSNCTIWRNWWQVLASNGTALVPQHSFDGNTESLLADFNADGLTDIAYWAPGGVWQLLIATGSRSPVLAGFSGPHATAASAPPVGGRAMIIDWDADGRTDLLQPTASGELQYCRSTGRSLEGCLPAGIGAGTIPTSPMTLDPTGDSYPDLVFATSNVRLYIHHHVPPDLLVSATDGYGLTSTFEYTKLSNPLVHKVSAGAVFPVRDLARPGVVVSKMLRDDSRGREEETYLYEGAKLHAQGRGFLGFARRTITPSIHPLVRVEEFHQDPAAYERIGAPSRITLQQRSGVPVTRTSYTWARHSYGSGTETRRFGYPSSVTLERYELDGLRVSSTVTSNTFDTFGTRLRQSEVTTQNAKGLTPWAQHTQVTSLDSVVNDTTNWCLGRPAATRISRSHTLPGGAEVTRSFAHGWDYLRCRPSQQVIEPSSTTLRVTTDFAYDAYGNETGVTVTPVGQVSRTTTHTWIENGRLRASTKNPQGHVEQLVWDSVAARPTTTIDANGLSTLLQYDGLNRPTRRTRPDGTATVVSQTLCGSACAWPYAYRVVTVSERGVGDTPIQSAEAGYDRNGRELYTREELPGGAHAFRVKRYDSLGRLQQEGVPGPCCATPTLWIKHAYDTLGRRVSVERPTSQSNTTPVFTRWRYDGLSVTETDPLGRATTRRHDASGNVLQVIDPGLTDVDFEYDAFGNLVKTRDLMGTETVVTYDVRGLRRSLNDPDAGRWTYDYFPLGEIRSQTNARGQKTTYTYDKLSRAVSRVEPEGTTTWTWGTSTSARNIGSLATVSAPGFQESYQYDSLGRPSAVTTTIAGATLVSRQTYDATSGLPDTLTYPVSTGPTPLRVRYQFDRGRLTRVSDVDVPATYWQLNAVNVLGQVADETLGNGVRVASGYDSITGRLVARTAGIGGGTSHQNLAFAWDAVGNLLQREERNRGVYEQFVYDNRDRLDYAKRAGSVTLDLSYDETGNITYKSDVGTYRYDSVRKHAVVAAGANNYTYDANGAVLNANGTSIKWLSYDLPSQLTHPAGNYSAFYYGPDRTRYRQVANAGGALTETLYAAGGLYERVTTGGVSSHRHYIVADGRRVAVHTRKSGATPNTVYLLEDHLGGVDGFTAASGALLTKNSYQPFGARRSGDGLSGTPTAAEWLQIQSTTARGYTDHEHLDHLGIIHMNGRVYDPALGRFLSPDPVVQAPYDTQGQNRYAYVRNNPLRYTDPSGYFCAGPAAGDPLSQQCMDHVVIKASRLFTERPRLTDRWYYDAYLNASSGAGSLRGSDGSAAAGPSQAPIDESGVTNLVVTASRLPNRFDMPADIRLAVLYNVMLSGAIDRLYAASTQLGESAVEHYVSRESATGNPLYHIPGAAAALWTPSTAPLTSMLLGVGSGLGRWSARPYWQYYPAGTRGYRSTWLTRGNGWSPPYETGSEAASMLSLPAYNPGTAVRAVQPNWYDFVRGPRVSAPQPTFGPHAVGGGTEYRVIPFGE
jgi:RHS repeat-associated protein